MATRPLPLLPTLIASAFSLAVLTAMAGQVPAQAEPLLYGPDTCIQGFVWRDGRPGDHVCVTPDVRAATAQQNAAGAGNREPDGGAYGPNTCKQGFVWREAFGGDAVCVTPDVREQARNDNAAAESRKQANLQAEAPAASPVASPRNVPTRACWGHLIELGQWCPLIPPSADRWSPCPDTPGVSGLDGACPRP